MARRGGHALASVRHRHRHIAPEHQGRIFERFYQVNGSGTRRYGGIGLGLAVVKEIIQAHGGHVMVESQLGKGTTFTILLPVA